jgi:hypothetical protein
MFYHSKEVIYVFSESSNIWISQTLYVWLVFTNQLGSLYLDKYAGEVQELMTLTPTKRQFYQRGMRATSQI